MNTNLFIPVQRSTEFDLTVVDFDVVVEPASIKVLKDFTARYYVSFQTQGNFVSPLHLAVGNLPQGATATFSLPNPVAVTDTVELTIETTNMTPGSYRPCVIAVPS